MSGVNPSSYSNSGRSALSLLLPVATLLASALVGCSPEVPDSLSLTPQQPPSSSSTSIGADGGAGSGTSSGGSASTPTGATVDSATVLASIAQGAYQSSGAFTEVTRAPYGSAAVPGVMIREWVSNASLSAYEAISPGVTGSNVIAPVGTTIVRAVLEDDGGVGSLTLMYKGPAGYNSSLGDWWFGVTDPNGVPAQTDAGAEVGLLSGCFGCHVPRANDGYLFGVPLDDRSAAGGSTTGADAGAPDSGSTTTADAGDDAGEDAGTDSGTDSGSDSGGGHHHGGHVVEDETSN